MPCNAHGHPPTCECGWGGINYDPWRPNLNPDWSRAASHTIPNARCPVCRNHVFFYRSSDGGAVFFDQLGPPWPKHPCTDKTITFAVPRDKPKKRGRKKKQQANWWPYPCAVAESLPNGLGTCLHGEDGKRLFIQTKASNIPANTPIWIRASKDIKGKYEVSTFKLKNGIPVNAHYIGFSAKGVEHSNKKNED